MAFVTVTEAAKLTQKARKTIYAHIKSGRLSKAAGGMLDTSELMRCYGAFPAPAVEVLPKALPTNENVPPSNVTENSLIDRRISMLPEELEAIIKGAVKAALLEAMPLLLENTMAKQEEPLAIADDVELMRDGTPFKKLDFSDIPSL